MDRAGVGSPAELLQIVERDTTAYQTLVDRLTINVSQLFRNPDQFHILSTVVLPELMLARDEIRIWSAGCSYGAEPVSLAIAAMECFAGRRFTILATDVDDGVLEKASGGAFSEADMKNVSDERRRRWFRPDAGGWRCPAAEARISFEKHDVLSGRSIGTFDLISCRNVSIYFTEEAKERAHGLLVASLSPGGYVFIGSSEFIAHHNRLGLTNPFPFFYHLPATERRPA